MQNPVLLLFVGKNGAKTFFVITGDAKIVIRDCQLPQAYDNKITGSSVRLRQTLRSLE